MYSQYLRYALDEFKGLNLYYSEEVGRQKKLKLAINSKTVTEHVVPHSIIMEMLFNLDPLSCESLFGLINKYYYICVITAEEDKRLSAAGLKSKMPEGWDSENVFARYDHLEVQIPRERVVKEKGRRKLPI